MSNTVELSGEIKHETVNAILFWDGDMEDWIPLSQVSEIHKKPNGSVEIVVAEWIAKKKGFI